MQRRWLVVGVHGRASYHIALGCDNTWRNDNDKKSQALTICSLNCLFLCLLYIPY